MKIIKNSLITLGLVLGFTLSAFAASTTVTVGPSTSGMTNVLPLSQGSLKVTSIIISSSSTNQGTVNLIDTYTNWLGYTNSAYSNILSYATNYVSTWTNYYGRTNSTTNISLVDVTNSAAGTTNAFPVRLVSTVPTNNTITLNGNFYFENGIWASNTLNGSVSLTIIYTQ